MPNFRSPRRMAPASNRFPARRPAIANVTLIIEPFPKHLTPLIDSRSPPDSCGEMIGAIAFSLPVELGGVEIVVPSRNHQRVTKRRFQRGDVYEWNTPQLSRRIAVLSLKNTVDICDRSYRAFRAKLEPALE